MVASVIETITGTVPASTTNNYTPTTTFTANDLIVVAVGRGSASSAVNITGLSVTFQKVLDETILSTSRYSVHWAKGASGSGTISVQNTNSTTQAQFIIYIIRGLTNPGLSNIRKSASAGGTSQETNPVPFAVDQFALKVGQPTTTGTFTFTTASSNDPDAGWTAGAAGGGPPALYTAYAIGLGTDTSARAKVTASSSQNMGVVILVFGSPSTTPAAPVAGSPVVIQSEMRWTAGGNPATWSIGVPLDPTDVVVWSTENIFITTPTLTIVGASPTVKRPLFARRCNSSIQHVFWATGMTGNVGYTLGIGSTDAWHTVFVIRGLNTQTLESMSITPSWGSTLSVGKATGTAQVQAGQVSIYTGMIETASGVRTPNMTPSTGWNWIGESLNTGSASTGDGPSTLYSAYRVHPEADTNIVGQITFGTTSYNGAAMLTFGAPNVPLSTAVDIVHHVSYSLANPGSTTGSQPLGFSPLSTDYILVLMHKGYNGTNMQLSFDSVGWAELLLTTTPQPNPLVPIYSSDSPTSAGGGDLYIYGFRGVVGPTNMTLSIPSTGQGAQVHVWVLRGVRQLLPTEWDDTPTWTANRNTDETAGPLTLTNGRVAIGLGWWAIGADGIFAPQPAPVASPGSWTQESFYTDTQANASTRLRVVSYEATGAGSANLLMDYTGAGNYYGAWVATFGTDAPAPPAPSGHSGWGGAI